MYKSLADSTRKLNVSATASTEKADRLEDPHNSIDWKGEAWYRVMGDAGTRIPENPYRITDWQSVPVYDCGTFCPGYLPSGSHPKTPGQLVDNVKVCYFCNYQICNQFSNYIKIRHCGEYFVYYLTRTDSSRNRYCTE